MSLIQGINSPTFKTRNPSSTFSHKSLAIGFFTVTVHLILPHFWFFFQIRCFLHWIQPVDSIFFLALCDNGSFYILVGLDSPAWKIIFFFATEFLPLIQGIISPTSCCYSKPFTAKHECPFCYSILYLYRGWM